MIMRFPRNSLFTNTFPERRMIKPEDGLDESNGISIGDIYRVGNCHCID